MIPDLLIYQDYIHNNGQLHHALRPYGAVDFCDAADILNGILNQRSRLLVMPGGADLYFCEKLNGKGNAAIRDYVEHGGAYLGICAGAYYGCNALSWAAGTEQEITGFRELAFYSGTATGPALPLMQGLNQSWLGAAELLLDDGSRVTSCYEAGPVFLETCDDDDTKIIARYATLPGQPAAIIGCRVGCGYAILSGPHVERLMPSAHYALYRHTNPHHTYENAVYQSLESGADGQQRLWELLMNRLLNHARGRHDAA